MRALGPGTVEKYERALARAYEAPARLQGLRPEVHGWPNGSKAMLKAAIRWRAAEIGQAVVPGVAEISLSYSVQRRVRGPDEEEAARYEVAANELPPGLRALALIPIKLGLRAEEVLGLLRLDVQRAVRGGELVLLRKGGREHVLPASKVTGLLEELLEAERMRSRRLDAEGASRGVWQRAGEIISTGNAKAQYNALWRLIRQTGKSAKLDGSRPHLLRHAFATRMNRDGAPFATIQAALGHSKPATTARYVSPSAADINRYVR
jgi:integrase